MKTEAPHSQASAEKAWEVTETFWGDGPGTPSGLAKLHYCWNVKGDDIWLPNISKLEQARLIAVAPELLKTLKAMTRLTEVLADDTTEKEVGYGGKTVRENIHDAKALIAKALIAKAEKQP